LTLLKNERINIDKKFEIVSIYSRGQKDVETRYSTIERKSMAITLTNKYMCHIILGDSFPLVVLTDHKNLTVGGKFEVC
jgi:RNase H-like domain found in reverse transcriptase